MEIKIEKGATILDLKRQFADAYGGLKLEMFKMSHEAGESSNSKMRMSGQEIVGDVTTVMLPVSLTISAKMTVAEVESAFETQAGLHVQVFRKMRNIWIETVQTDGYSLEKQMELSSNSVTL